MKSYKTELDLNNRQRSECLRYAGTARWVYNWGLQKKQEAFASGVRAPMFAELCRELAVMKKTTHPWLATVSKWVAQWALRNLDRAYADFFRRCKAKVKKHGPPKFKKRRHGVGAFTVCNVRRVSRTAVWLPCFGWLRLKEHGYFPTNVLVTSATVSERAGRWFVAIHTHETPVRARGSEVLGVDVGVAHLAILSDGTKFENPRARGTAQRSLRRAHKAVSRAQKGSANHRKAVYRLARRHYRVCCVRGDAIHKATAAITKRAAVVGIESLDVHGLVKNHRVAAAIMDASPGELHRQLIYKMEHASGQVVHAERFFPSSKMCSTCGHVLNRLLLNARRWVCPACGAEHDRDVNAAINLKHLAASSAVTACGEGSIRPGFAPSPEVPSTKQEPSIVSENGTGDCAHASSALMRSTITR